MTVQLEYINHLLQSFKNTSYYAVMLSVTYYAQIMLVLSVTYYAQIMLA